MKLKLKYLLFLLTTLSINNSFAQSKAIKNELSTEYTNTYFGLGIGFDYGAIGIKAEFLPSKYIGVFGGAGYALIDPAFNVGLSGKLLPDRNLCPTITAMYGYNAVIKIEGSYSPTVSGSKIYYGPTVGAGAELKTGRTKKNKLSFGVWLPFRNSDFQKDYDGLKDAGYEFQQDILPVAFSIGFNFGIGRKVDKE
jgi:hypothetical protein